MTDSHNLQLQGLTTEQLLNALSAHIAVLDETGTVLCVNATWSQFAEINGMLNPDFGVGMNYLTICDQSAADQVLGAAEVAAGIRAILNGTQEAFFQDYTCDSPTVPRWFQLRARLTQGTPLRIVVVHEDITEVKALEAQMVQAQKMQALGTLSGGIAHEFNNILAIILAYANLTQYQIPIDSKAWQNLQEVEHAVERAQGLVQQILTFSRADNPTLTPLPLSLIVDESLLLVQPTLPSTVALRRPCAQDVGSVAMDRTHIHQIIMNLCANAVYAMGNGGGVLEVYLERVEDDVGTVQASDPSPSPMIRLRIADTGEGMPADIVSQIFDPFFTTKDIGAGTGMGLAIVHGIVTQHGGTRLPRITW